MINLATYLPQDRRRALASGQALPNRTIGSTLFADISGFTPLTEKLTQTLGPRRGIEALIHQINQVYEALISAVEQQHGSVIDFAGDAITCWFEGDTGLRAVTAAHTMQQAMHSFAAVPLPDGTTITLALKTAVASGPARRFIVGDPAIQRLDALAGDTIGRMATAARLAQAGELLLDIATAITLHPLLEIAEWRTEEGTRFALVANLRESHPPTPLPPADDPAHPIAPQAWREWLLPAVYEREQAGEGAFLTEFRPTVALFVRFAGIDYESEHAQEQLDTFIRHAQRIASRTAGVVLQLTIGDKGSYLYLVFGAPIAHEDDAYRAVKVALELKQTAAQLPFLEPLQIGLSQGTMRAGVYGSATRRSYAVLGDEVNLAARLMIEAAPGEIWVSGRIHKTVAADFACEARPPLLLKGKAEPVPIFVIIGQRQHRALRLQEPTYALPMVGREAELQRMAEKLALARAGQTQLIGIVGEAGLGKSRLVAELIGLANEQGFTSYGGTCQADGLDTPYLVWKGIWAALFGLDPDMPLAAQIRLLETGIARYAPQRLEALPLLAHLLELELPDNAFTKGLEPKNRKQALHALLEVCLQEAARQTPLLLVFEDVNWMDALSHDLLDELARATTHLPICFVSAYRPPQLVRLAAPRLESLPNFTKIELGELTAEESTQAIQAKLSQLYPAHSAAVPPALAQMLIARAQGNPFYLEELLNYLHDRDFDPRYGASLEQIKLPDTLHSLILSRIDQLAEQQKMTLRVASIVGRLFRAEWLTGYYPALGAFPQVKHTLAELDALDITLRDSAEPELAYLFKHIVTHEVTYESLPFATRAKLHEQLAHYLESIAAPVEAIAHHYGLSDNKAKQREFFQKAADAAEAAFANDAALNYLARLLPLLDEPEAQIKLHLQLGAIMQFVGQTREAEMVFRAGHLLAEQTGDALLLARGQFALGKFLNSQGNYAEAERYLAQAQVEFTAAQDHEALSRIHNQIGETGLRQGDYAKARLNFEQGLAMAQKIDQKALTANALNGLAIMTFYQGDYHTTHTLEKQVMAIYEQLENKPGLATVTGNMGTTASLLGDYAGAQGLYERSLALGQEIGDKQRVIQVFINMGLLTHEQGDLPAAQVLQEQALALLRQTGNKYYTAATLINLGNLAIEQRDIPTAQATFSESLALAQEMNDQNNTFYNLSGLAAVAALQQEFARAARLASAAETLRLSLGTAWDRIERRVYEGAVSAARAGLGEAEFQLVWAEGEQMTVADAVAYAFAK